MAQAKLYPCPRCRNPVSAKIGQCWKCGTRLKFVPAAKNDIAPGPKEAAVPAVLVSRSEPAINSSSFGLAGLLLTITLIAVCLALFAAAPGLGIIMAVLALPAFIRTLMVVEQRKKSGKPVSTNAKVGLYLGSFGVTLVVTIVTVFASALTFCLSCLGGLALMTNSGQRYSEGMIIFIAIGLTILVTGLLIWAFSKWIRNRWRRDIAKS